jgi:hypothetical protein
MLLLLAEVLPHPFALVATSTYIVTRRLVDPCTSPCQLSLIDQRLRPLLFLAQAAAPFFPCGNPGIFQIRLLYLPNGYSTDLARPLVFPNGGNPARRAIRSITAG